MSTFLPYTDESRSEIRNLLDAPSGNNELTKGELAEVYEILTEDPPNEYWPVYRLRREVLDELSEHVDTDLSRQESHHHTHFRQVEIWHLTRVVTDLAGSERGGQA